jgi:hypothetical protein
VADRREVSLKYSTGNPSHLLIPPIISVLKHEISEFTFATHDVKNEDLSLGVTVEYATWATDHLAIAVAFKFRWGFARGRVLLKALNSGEHSLYQCTCGWRTFERDVFRYVI